MTRRFPLLLLVLLVGCGPQPQPTTAPPAVVGPPGMPKAEVDARLTAVANLKGIGEAMHEHHDSLNRLPAASTTLDGKGLSWRVQILPYMGKEGQELYAKFHPFEPWDSPHNKTLIDQMPPAYASPGKPAEKGMTHLRGIVGLYAFFPSSPLPAGEAPLDFVPGSTSPPKPNGPRVKLASGGRLVGITDGTSNTVMVVEAAEPVIWTKPDELRYDGDATTKPPLPKLGGMFPGGFMALFADGQVRFVTDTTEEAMIRSILTARGGEAP